MTVHWGLLSTATINEVILRSCRESPAASFVAVASRSLDRARAYADAHGIPRAWGSYDELLADDGVEAVYVSVPNGLHVRWALAALAAGKHVLCEKALTRHAHEVEQLYDAAERAGLVFAEAFMYRHHPQTDRFLELVDDGIVGRLVTLRSSFSFPMPPSEHAWRLPPELDAGALMDIGCYQVGSCRLLAGEPTTVYGEQVLLPTGVDLRFAGTMRFPGDVVAQFDCALDLPFRNELEIVGTEGTLIVTDPWECRGSAMRVERDGKAETLPTPRDDPYRLEFEAFARAVAGERVAAFERDWAVAQARTIGALYESAVSGLPSALG